jgi:hypothetical protein
MTDATIDLLKNYLLLEPDGTAVLLPGGGDFWSQLMSGDATDSGIRRLMGSEKDSPVDGQREGAAAVGVVYGRRLDKLGNASSG